MIVGTATGLRAIAEEDLPVLLSWRNTPEYRQYFREYRELSVADQRRWYENVVRDDPSVCMFSIVELSSDDLVGACGLCYIDRQNQNADLSIYVGKDQHYIDDELAPDAAKILLRYGFEELNLHRVWAEIYSTDTRKQALFDGLGFSLEGRHRQTRWVNGAWVDSYFYGILRDEFEVGG